MSHDVFDFMKIWTQGDPDSERRISRFLLDGLDRVVQNDSDLLSMLKQGDSISTPVVRWMEEWGYPSRITARLSGNTLSLSGYLFGKPIDAKSVCNVVREGTILERETDGTQVKVRSVDGLTAAVAGYGNSSPSDDAESGTWEIIAEAWSDYRDASSPRSLGRIFREVGTQIHAETFEIPKTRKNTKYEIVNHEVQHQIAGLLDKLRRQVAYSVLRSRPFHDGADYVYGNKTPESTMCGLCTWPTVTHEEFPNPNVLVNKGLQALSKQDLDNLITRLWLDENADFNQGDWWIVCHPLVHEFIHDFDISYRRTEQSNQSIGFHVDEFHSKIGKTFPILSERYMRPDTLIVVNFEKFRYGYFNKDRMNRKEIPTQGRYQRWLVSFQTYGLVARNPRANVGMIYGLATD